MSGTFQQYERVRLVSNNWASDGAPAGTIGYIIEVYDDGAYEIEVSNSEGATVAQFVAQSTDLEPAEPDN